MGEWATWRSLWKLYADGVLYSLDPGLEPMSQIGLWLIASRISEAQLSEVETELGGLERVGPGVWQGFFIGSPVTVIHLHELPLSLSAMPLLMVYRWYIRVRENWKSRNLCWSMDCSTGFLLNKPSRSMHTFSF